MTSRRAALVILAFIALVGCSRSTPAALASPAGDWPSGRTFTSTSVTENGTDRPLVAGSTISLRFQETDRIVAQAGCNTIGARGRVDGNRFIAEGLASTAMGCAQDLMAQDTWLVDFLSAEPSWQLTGDVLVLTAGATVITLRGT